MISFFILEQIERMTLYQSTISAIQTDWRTIVDSDSSKEQLGRNFLIKLVHFYFTKCSV